MTDQNTSDERKKRTLAAIRYELTYRLLFTAARNTPNIE
jgi:hypothetical protein